MRGARVGCSDTNPFRIEPEIGKILEYVTESASISPSIELWDVLQPHESRSHVSNDLGDRRPEPTIVLNTLLPACR
jgi:hypothetical protein